MRSRSTLALEKRYVQSLFDAIAYRYDLLNHLLSGGVDVYWRRRAAERLRGGAMNDVLDVATGTGDFGLAAIRIGARKVVGVDIAEAMLERGREKIERRGLADRFKLATGEAEKLAFPDASFDAAIVAFGARNFEHLDQGIAEMHRVLRDAGRIVVLEFSKPRLFPFKHVYLFYFRHVLPLIGRYVSGHDQAYSYLPETVMQFPEGENFLQILRDAGFKEVAEERLTFGIATIYTGTKQP
ncbi:MAG TPA: bifunctional demethylmenaquinone methyltransferase/2-methoxy-6-polyprenyl-1,4-benzoquinol methylase UbiE [Bacteroidota bacterium]|nr:bifunctional demethylmenaquinone methyltransferase/2-methoxy-6-polyprenyl-1,4-benzoquinol methylase UbiE [Bacteroidota bacterium]